MPLASTCKVKSKLTWSLGSMLTFNLFHSWMHAHSHFSFMQWASTCEVRFKLTWSFECMLTFNLFRTWMIYDLLQLVKLDLYWSSLACSFSICFHAMNNMQLVSTCKVGFKLTLSCGCMFVPTCSYLWMHVYSHFDYMQFAFNSFHEQHACLRLASTCKVGFKLTWSFEGTLSSNLVILMNDMRLVSISLFHFELRLTIWCMLTLV